MPTFRARLLPAPNRAWYQRLSLLCRCSRSHSQATSAISPRVDPPGGQQALDAVAALGPLVLQVLEAPVQLAAVLVGLRRHLHHGPDLLLAAVVAHQQPQQGGGVDPVGLGPAGPAVAV